MKKSSVLIRRAAFFTAIILLILIAVGLPVFQMIYRRQAASAAREQIIPQAKLLAESAAAYAADDSAQLMGEVNLFALSGGSVWLTDTDRETVNLSDEQAYPEKIEALQETAFEGGESTGMLRLNGWQCVYAVTPVMMDGSPAGAITVVAPVFGTGLTVLASFLAALAALAAALAVGVPLIHKILDPAVRPIVELRDVAVSVAGGNLDARANEHINGELGELGKALNNLSYQLSRNMYTLIVERNRLKHMIDGLSEGIVAIDNQGHVTHTNPALERLFQKQKLALHLPDARLKWIPDKSVWDDFDGVIRTGTPMTRNLESRDMILRLTITPIVDEIGAIAGAVGLVSDITQMERLERTRRDYVSNVSHELRTPLTAMRALIEPLKEGMVTTEADRMRYYDIILREIMRLSRLINDQLELSRLQSGTLSIKKSRMRLDDLVYDVCDRYNAIAEEHGLALNVLTDFSECPVVYANADRVEQMLIILLDNAIKYTEEGSVSLSATWDDDRVVISVKDTGIGIEETDLPYVFDRFYKVDKAHSGKGSGLGLSIASELLKQMEEEIWVTSEKGHGTEFCFTIHCAGNAPEGETDLNNSVLPQDEGISAVESEASSMDEIKEKPADSTGVDAQKTAGENL